MNISIHRTSSDVQPVTLGADVPLRFFTVSSRASWTPDPKTRGFGRWPRPLRRGAEAFLRHGSSLLCLARRHGVTVAVVAARRPRSCLRERSSDRRVCRGGSEVNAMPMKERNLLGMNPNAICPFFCWLLLDSLGTLGMSWDPSRAWRSAPSTCARTAIVTRIGHRTPSDAVGWQGWLSLHHGR